NAPQNVQITQGPNIENVTDTQAEIAWSTNVNANSVIRYGTDQNNMNQTAKAPWGGLTHRVTINNLEPGKTYYFKVVSVQAEGSGTRAASGVQSFTTKGTASASTAQPSTTPQSDQPFESGNTTGQSILTSNFNLSSVDAGSATLVWSTQVGSSAIVRYGTDVNN